MANQNKREIASNNKPAQEEILRRVEPRYSWKNVPLTQAVLDSLKDICNQARQNQQIHRDLGLNQSMSTLKGFSALFTGPYGTGKTMAAAVIASDLGLPLYRIDLSALVSKYIGETEKNLSKVFDVADSTNSILFFDEADALFGKRSEVRDSHDRYANIEITYLLQKLENFQGITILATNLRENLDDAFLRRIRFIVEFPSPSHEERRSLWETLFGWFKVILKRIQ